MNKEAFKSHFDCLANMSDANSDNSTSAPIRTQDGSKKRSIPALKPPNNNLGEDELMMKKFYDLMQIKADKGEWERIWAEPMDRKAINDAIRPSFTLATVSTIATFVFLRKVPAWYMNRALSTKESFFHGAKGHPHYDSARRQKNIAFPRIKTHRDGSTSFHEGLLIKPLTLAMDATVSLIMGAAVWFYTIDKKGVFSAVSRIPLAEGTSAVSDTLCQDFIEEKKTIPKKVWNEYNDDAVLMLKQFIDNCRRRQQYERQLRIERGLQPEEPVSIPPPGVPADLMIEDEEERTFGLADLIGQDDSWAGDDADDWDDDDKGFWGR